MSRLPPFPWRVLRSTGLNFGLCLLLTAYATTSARACNVPVFRYALERWKPSNYEAHVFHKGPLTPEQKKQVERLSAPGANLNVSVIDLGGKVPTRSAENAV